MSKNNETPQGSNKPLTEAQRREVQQTFDRGVGKALRSTSSGTERLLARGKKDEEKMRKAFEGTELAGKQARKPIDKAKEAAKKLTEQNPDFKQQQETMMLGLRTKNKEKYLVWAEGLKTIPPKTMVKNNVKNVPPLENMFGVEVPVILINKTTYAIRDKADGKFYIAGTKESPVLKPGDMLDLPYSKGSYGKLIASARGAEGVMVAKTEAMAKAKATDQLLAKDVSELTTADIRKMTPSQLRSKFLDSNGKVDFKGSKLVSLKDLFGAETEYLLVYDHKADKAWYAKRESNGTYNYIFGRKGKVSISSGDMVSLQTQKDVNEYKLALDRDAAEKDRVRSYKREIAVRNRNKRMESLNKYLAKTDLDTKDKTMLTKLLISKYPKFDIRKKANADFMASLLKDYKNVTNDNFHLPREEKMLASLNNTALVKPSEPETAVAAETHEVPAERTVIAQNTKNPGRNN